MNVSADHLLLGKSLTTKDSGKATVVLSLTDMVISNPLGEQLLGGLLNQASGALNIGGGIDTSDFDNFRGQLKNATFTLDRGVVTQNATFMIGSVQDSNDPNAKPKELYPFAFGGDIRLSDLAMNLDAGLPMALVRDKVKGGDFAKILAYLPDQLPIGFAGTTTAPKINFKDASKVFSEALFKYGASQLTGGKPATARRATQRKSATFSAACSAGRTKRMTNHPTGRKRRSDLPLGYHRSRSCANSPTKLTPRAVLDLAAERKIQFIDLRFMDFPGLWQHTSFPISELSLDSFDHGFGFDGSSIRGWQAINESDMLLIPVADTARLDPFLTHPTLSMICDVRDPITKKEYSRDPRSIARKCIEHLHERRSIADSAQFGPELEFFVFDQAWYDQGTNFAKYYVGSNEGPVDAGRRARRQSRPQGADQGGLLPVPANGHASKPTQRNGADARRGSASRSRRIITRSRPAGSVKSTCAISRSADDGRQRDDVQIRRQKRRRPATARRRRSCPSRSFQDNGSGMHVHFSLWKDAKPLFGGQSLRRPERAWPVRPSAAS